MYFKNSGQKGIIYKEKGVNVNYGARTKKLAFLANAIALTPPPLAVSGHGNLLFTCKNINVLKQKKSEMDDFERKQTLVLMEKY